MPTIAAGSFTAMDIQDGIGNFKDIMRLLKFLFVTSCLFFLACGDDSSANDGGNNPAEVGGACNKDAIDITIDKEQKLITAHISATRNDCSVKEGVLSFAGETKTIDRVLDYQFVGDTLILAWRGEGFVEMVMVGGKNGNLSARWKVLPGYRYINGTIQKVEESSLNTYYTISENCLFIEDGPDLRSRDFMESEMVAWIYDNLFSHYKFDHSGNAYGSFLFTNGGDHVASDQNLYGITVLEKTQTSETISAFGQTVSIRFSDIEYDSRYFIYSSYKATVEANGSACVYDYLYASEVPEEFCKAEYKDFIELDGDKAVRVNNDNTVDFAECLSKLLP